MCSAYDSKEIIEKAYESGMKDILTKPVLKNHLKQIVETYLIK